MLNGNAIDISIPSSQSELGFLLERDTLHKFGVFPVAAIYGKNASGKSKLLKSLYDMAEEVIGYASQFRKHYRNNLDMNLCAEPIPDSSTLYEICLIYNDCEYTLSYSIYDDYIRSERLTLSNANGETILYDRAATDAKKDMNIEYSLLMSKTGTYKLWFSSLAAHPDFRMIGGWFENVFSMIDYYSEYHAKNSIQNKIKDVERAIKRQGDSFKKRMMRFLQCLDDSIVDIRVEMTELHLIHKFINNSTFRVPVIDESSGLRNLIILFPHLDRVMQEGGLLIYDNLDTNLHPIVFKQLVRMFNNSEINKRNAQLIFTAHNTYVLNSDFLHKQEVHIVDKDENLVSVVNRLDKFTYVAPYPHMEFDYRTGYYYSFPEHIAIPFDINTYACRISCPPNGWNDSILSGNAIFMMLTQQRRVLKMIKYLKFVGYDGRTYPVYEDQEKQYWKDVNLGKGTPRFLRPTNYGGKEDFYGIPEHPLTDEYEIVESEPIGSPYLSKYKRLSMHKNLCTYLLGIGRGDWDLYSEDTKRTVISEMKECWHMFPENEKPNWCTLEQIEEYERLLLKADTE